MSINSHSKRFKHSPIDSDDEEDISSEHRLTQEEKCKTKVKKRRSEEAGSTSKRVKSVPSEGSSHNGDVGGDCGIIEKVCLTNFMCHKKLEVDLGQNVNLILGRNGSGKSAIMSAIYIGLGGRAQATNRANSIRSFIQKGQTFAEVEVCLRNLGPDAYQPDRFGNLIHVVRRLSRDGSSTYRIQSEDRKTKATTKEELLNILEQFSIQIENPISMLNQDTSRSFLAANNPSNMCKLFMKATHLEQMCQDYDHIDQSLGKLKYVLAAKGTLSKEMEHEIKNLENIYKGMDRIISLEAKLKTKYAEHAWALVKEKEKEMTPIERKIKKYERGLEKCDKEIDHSSIKLKEHQEQFSATKEEFEGIGNKASEVHTERDQFSAQISSAKQAKQQLESQLREIQRDIVTCRKERSFYEKNIRELKERAKEDLTAVWEEREREVERLAHEGHETGEKLASMEQELEQSQSEHSGLREKLEDFRSRNSALEEKISRTSNGIKRLQQSQTSRINVYGGYMQALTDRIKAHSRSFSHPPKGPIGAYLSVKEKRWALGVEACIEGGKMKSFLVHNMNDRVLLNRLIKEVCSDNPPTIVVTSFTGRPYNIDRFRAQSKYPTVFDMISCSDVDVMNYLVDSTKIETVILIEGQQEATNVMWKSAPPNCTLAYTLDGDTIKKKGSFSNRVRAVRYLEEDVLKSIDSHQQNMRDLQREKTKLSQMVEACQSEIQHQGKSAGKLRVECKRLNGCKKDLERKVEDLRAKTSEEQKQQVEIEPFENALQESIHKEEACKAQVKEMNQSLQTAKSRLEEVHASKREVEERYEGLKEQMEGFKRKLNEFKEQKDEAREHMKYFQEKRVSVEDVIRTDTAACEKMRDEAEQLASEALKKCGERVDAASTSQALQSEIKETNKAILEQQKSQKMSREECTQKLTKRLDDYKQHKRTMKVMLRLYNKLSVALQIRLKKHQELQDMIIIRASNYFQTHLSKRNYSGRIRFDAKAETLTLDVTTNKLNKQGTQNTCTLSGGERSYITVCFIMSLWETMESPFRCLDEFDVFMDMVNRAISIEIMMKTASDFPDRQFVFFTPLDMTSYITNNENVKILQLSQPERGNSS